jgi:hypothetical protein
MLADIEKPTTVLALLAGAGASAVSALLTVAELVQNWMEPGCDPGMGKLSSSCAVNSEDYTRTLPFAALTLVVVLTTTFLCQRVLRHEREIRGTARSATVQVAIALTVPVLAVLVLLAFVASEMVR